MKKIIIIPLVAITLLLFGCSKEISYETYDEFTLGLANGGYTIEEEDVGKSILSGQRKWLTANGDENMSVYIYESNDKMEKDSAYISKDGFSYDKGKEATEISWTSYPHFFKKDNMIVLYAGENVKIINLLKEIVGPQFAGEMQ